MTKPFGYYGITEITAINLEKIHGPALQGLPEHQRRNIAAALLGEDDSFTRGHLKDVVSILNGLTPNQRIAAAKAIINTL